MSLKPMLPKALTATNYFFKNQTAFYRGKVRDVYTIADKYLVVVACDRLSAFDHVLPKPIPFKGQVLNEVAATSLDKCSDIIKNWKISTPDPQVTIGYKCKPILVEFVVRGYLAGHAWRVYKEGGRKVCGVKLPNGLKQNDRLPQPIITPSTKASSGHDEDISLKEILDRKLVSAKGLEKLEYSAIELFKKGTELAAEKGLILVDTKYEFGKMEDKIMVIDEIHTPDSSRFFYANSYEELQKKEMPQRQLSKEFVREWLMDHNFQGLKGELVPDMPDDFINEISGRYIELYEAMTNEKFIGRSYQDIIPLMEENIYSGLANLEF